MKPTDRVYVAGHRGMVGSAIVRKLHDAGFTTIITRTHAELDLTEQSAVRDFFDKERPDYVVLAAAKVGGIYANSTYPADFIYQNLMMETNVIHSAYQTGVKKLLFLGSSCIYPKFAEQPMKVSALLTGALEPTNEAYAVAKIAGIVMCQSYAQQYGVSFISAMPTNLYGPNDTYELQNSHVLPALRIIEGGINLGFNFNKNFSMNAAFAQGERQKKSAGSFLMGLSERYQRIEADTSFVPPTQGSLYPNLDKLVYGNFISTIVYLGFGYQFVIKKVHFTPVLLAGSGFQFQSYVQTDKKRFWINFANNAATHLPTYRLQKTQSF